jgi:hypothetical protein
MTPYALDSFTQHNATRYKAEVNGKHYFLADAALDAVDLLHIEQDQQSKDLAHVLIQAKGHMKHRHIPGVYPHNYSASFTHPTIYVLARNHHTSSPKKLGLYSLNCLACGAPHRSKKLSECAYCGKVQNDGSLDWVLHEVKEYDKAHYIALLEAPSKQSKPAQTKLTQASDHTQQTDKKSKKR